MSENDQPTAERMIVEQSYWDESYKKLRFFRLPPEDATVYLMRKFIPEAAAGSTAFEIGCFPGRFLAELGALGYILNGCDITPRVVTDLSPWLMTEGYRVGEFFGSSYENHTNKKFDLVASFGFIEHFQNYGDVFLDHCKMVKEDGYLVIQFPNFRGSIQHKLHSRFDSDNLANHVVEAMDIEYYAKIIPPDFEILFKGYYGAFDFWFDDFRKTHNKITKRILKLFMKTKPLWRFAKDDERWSPNGAIIARRVNTHE